MALVYPTGPPTSGLVEADDEMRAIANRAAQRRLVLMGEQAQLRLRYEEVMQWANPPWDPVTRRVNPRPWRATPDRVDDGIHIDEVSQVLMRWAVLEMGAMPDHRVEPEYVAPPIPNEDPEQEAALRQVYNIERVQAQNKATQMENAMQSWIEQNNLQRTLLWTAWAKRAFGVAILRTGWDPIDKIPTCELMENPSQVYRGWTKLHGRRMLSWVNNAEAMAPEEANFRFGLDLPIADNGTLNWATWLGTDMGDMENRPEQMGSAQSMIWAEEYWELDREADARRRVMHCLIIGGRIVYGPIYYPWKRLPFHVVENEHIPTYQHSKSTAEAIIPINAAYDDMLDRQHTVIEFEAGPRYKGLNMWHSRNEVHVPPPFQMIPLREGEDIQQLDTRVDFFPTQLHASELREAKYEATGLTPIAWGMSPNAQTSGRALSAEWRAVELPLHAAAINWTPELLDVFKDWWDFAEEYDKEAKKIGNGYRRFSVVWEPLDVRDSSEKTLDVIQRLNANILDPESAIEETGKRNPDEIMAKIKAYLVDPIYNPLRYQQYLVLKQLSQQIAMQEMQMAQMQQQAGGQPQEQAAPPAAGGRPGAQVQQEEAPPEGQVAEYMNQPGQSPDGGGLPVDVGILSRTPLEEGSGNQITAAVQGGLPTG